MTLQPGNPMPGGHGSMRSSTADREREQRAGQAYRSLTYAELGALTADLPAGPLGAVVQPPALYPSVQYPPVQYPPVVPRRPVNSLAVAALVCSLIPGFPAVAAVIAGVAARQQIRQRGERGQGIATAAIVIGTISLVAFLLWQISIAGFS